MEAKAWDEDVPNKFAERKTTMQGIRSTTQLVPSRPGAVLIGVVGARGGLGASTLVGLLAAEMGRRTSAVAVDLAPGGGLDVVLGLEAQTGPRWPDLLGAADAPGDKLVDALPRWGATAVLSADRLRPSPRPEDVLETIAQAAGVIVFDLSRADLEKRWFPLSRCDHLLVLVGRDIGSVAGGVALLRQIPENVSRAGLVTRSGALSIAEVSETLRQPVLAQIPNQRSLPAGAERGLLLPGRQLRSSITKLADRLWADNDLWHGPKAATDRSRTTFFGDFT